MESKAILFKEQEKVFLERTGKDFATLYKKYYPKLIYFTSKMCNDAQKAEDISTDSFLTAFDKIDKYEKDKAQFSTWLFTIAKNLALQSIKNDKKNISLDIEYDEEGTTMKDFIQEEESDLTMQSVKDKKAQIMKVHISKLKEPYKSVIEMREIKRMSYKDIADSLPMHLFEITLNKVKVNSNNSSEINKLRKQIGTLPDELVSGNLDLVNQDVFWNVLTIDKLDFLNSEIKPLFKTVEMNLSTVKSMIRNGRSILIKETEDEFKSIDELYL
jgi:RNA polymerase sigma-70 factor (ECF subfamily)